MGNLVNIFVNNINLSRSKNTDNMVKISWGGDNNLREEKINKRE